MYHVRVIANVRLRLFTCTEKCDTNETKICYGYPIHIDLRGDSLFGQRTEERINMSSILLCVEWMSQPLETQKFNPNFRTTILFTKYKPVTKVSFQRIHSRLPETIP